MGCSVNYKVVSATGLVNTTDLLTHELSPPVLTQLLHYDVFFFRGKKGMRGEKSLHPQNQVVSISEELVILRLKANLKQ